jgi:4'-phosphopantetheinyl transferase
MSIHVAEDAPPWRKREHEAGRRLLAALLGDVIPGAALDAIKLGPNGKPVLRDAPEVGISISHSYPVVAVAVGVGWDVGVDVQVTPRPTSDDVTRLTHSLIPRPGTTQWDQLWAWTVREACVKATGAGLSGRPWRIPVDDADAGVWRELHWRSLRRVAPVPLSVAWLPHTSDAAPSPLTGGLSP